ncbi:LuxR C-terminal-related transcriptional regulator [Nocardioides sediminis]|uniref:LuxR C-terminal-related transcriptional regulator n=1 Tax=Nocardioides sediminis TaxID=433648 RepID=UPI00131F0BDB|nr:LuxR C-terminal-related transcriptional regulator [Nocardioides sediminis]
MSDVLDAVREASAAGEWDSAVRLAEQVPPGRRSPELLEELARAHWWRGDVRASLRSRDEAFTGYRDRGDRDAAVMVAVDLCVVWMTNLENEVAARGWVARARRLVGTTDQGVGGWLTLLEGYLASDAETGHQLLARALDVGRAGADRDLELVALADLGLAAVMAGQVDEGMALLDEALAGVVGGDYRRLETFVWNTCSMLAACATVGDQRRAAQWCLAADRFQATYGCPFLQARCRSHYGAVLVGSGRWPEAEAQLVQALAMAQDLGRQPHVEALAALAELRLRQGSPEAADALLASVEDTLPVAVTLARLHLVQGNPSRAVSVLRACLDRIGDTGPQSHAATAILVEALVASRRLEDARRVAEHLGHDAEVASYPQASSLAARAAGLVAAAVGDPAAARQHLSAAVQGFVRLDLPFEAARTRLDLARIVETDDPDLAASEASTAHGVLQRLGAITDADAAAALLRRLGVATRPGPRSANALTTRERQVLELLELGLSNPQIADRLCLSRKTVAHHVSSILTKLGLSSRAQAAAWAARRTGS